MNVSSDSFRPRLMSDSWGMRPYCRCAAVKRLYGCSMIKSFEYFHRQLSRATVAVLAVALSLFGLALLFALLGLPQAVVSFRQASFSAAFAFVVMFAIFLASSGAAGVLNWLDRRQPAVARPGDPNQNS